jgi:tetratricopeptide (TPR) repeat protein
VSAALEALLHGEFAPAETALAAAIHDAARDVAPSDLARWHLALGVARQRRGDLAGAERSFGEALAIDPALVAARLDRGALRARQGDWVGAREDFDHGGDGREGRWNRAALSVLESIASRREAPSPALMTMARAEVEPQSEYWSEHTVGRLVWTAIVERALADRASFSIDALRAAEKEMEFDTFWDRALVLHGYARLGASDDLARVATPLVESLATDLLSQPAVRGTAGRELRPPIETARGKAAAGDPRGAHAALSPLLGREDLRHYRVPCLHCGQGSIGVDAVEGETEE